MIDAVINAFNQMPVFFYISALVFGLSIGSFLNVVIFRLPIMMEREFKQSCEQYFKVKCQAQLNSLVDAKKFNLITPASRCPNCKKAILFYQNIPLLSYLFLGGKCGGCGNKISIQYPLVELIMGLLAVACACFFGVSWLFVAAFLICAALLTLSAIDYHHQLLPDAITLPMLWLGILLSLLNSQQGLFATTQQAILGAAIGYLSLWSVYYLFKITTGKEGMGFGDFKLLAMLGAWLGVANLPLIIILSATIGSVVGGLLIVVQKRSAAKPIPFGPYLAGAGLIALFFGDSLNRQYLSMIS